MAADPPRGLVGLAMATAVLSVSTASAAILEVETAGPVAIAFWRLALATALLLPLALLRSRAEIAGLARREVAVLAAVGVVLGLHFATWIASLETTSVASSVVLVTSHPILVGLVQHFAFGERLAPSAWWGIALALVGGAVIAWGDAGLGAGTLVADGLALAGAVCFAAYVLAGRRIRQRRSLLAYAVPVYAASTVTLALLAVGLGEPLSGFPARDWGLFLFLAVVPMLGGHTLFNWALKHVPATVVSTSVVAEPIGATILALLIVGQEPPRLSVAGGLLILAGIYLVVRAQGRGRARGT